MMTADEIRCIRIDIVDRKFTNYWFVTMPGTPNDSEWWCRLRAFLLSQPRQARGQSVEGKAPVEEARLAGNTRRKFVELLENGPDFKTVRRARKVFPATDDPIVVMFFGEDQPGS